jgi:hypothetical protein
VFMKRMKAIIRGAEEKMVFMERMKTTIQGG